MIKLFRKIRQNMIKENRVSKYILYAIGEIVLVVIGILIALSINNWNVDRKGEILRVELLKNLKVDMIQDLNRLSTIDRFINDRKNYAKFLLNILEDIPETIDSTKVFLALERCSFVHTFDPQMPTYSEMQGSGNLSLLKSDKLKKALATYKNFINTSAKIELRNANVMSDYSNAVLAYMDEEFGYIDINDTIAKAYKGLKFDLDAIAKDDKLKLLIKNVHNKSIIEQRFKNDLVKPRLERVIEIIDEQLNDTNR